MVAKQVTITFTIDVSYLLAKIHMVAKHIEFFKNKINCYLLAKIHMVAKPMFV